MTPRPDSPLVGDFRPSPNFEPRRGGARPSILLLHYTGLASAAKAIDWLTRAESRVSAHYVVDEAGVISQLVAEDMRAWHAGEAVWAGETDINSASIGIEVHNAGHEQGLPDFPEAQIAALEALCRDIIARHGIPPERVLAHSDVAPARKVDPGEKFPWARLAQAGVGHWVTPEPVNFADPGIARDAAGPLVAAVQAKLAAYGYGIEATGGFDPRTEFVVAAFQRHFRPERVDGRIDQSTITTLERLADALPRSKSAA
ncbi:MAG TPA: N-acetylmuramoyl-L-alanine amidase [Hyphomicrobiaceae bacterium]|nr:N-acetylmuramoyl-L-alanine amidase [Hyphomicrobiaceae bacterium]